MQSIQVSFHPVYISELGVTEKHLGEQGLQFVVSELQSGVSRFTELANHLTERHDLGPFRMAYLSMLVFTLEHFISLGNNPDFVTTAPSLAIDILEIACSIAKSRGEKLQLARTYWYVGREARTFKLFDDSLTAFVRAADTYVLDKRWEQVADAYQNLGLVEAEIGDKTGALGWLHISSDVDYAIGRPEEAEKTLSLARKMNADFIQYTAAGREASRRLSLIQGLSKNIREATAHELNYPNTHFIAIQDIPGLGQVIESGTTDGKSYRGHWELSDCLCDSIINQWPIGTISAQSVDLRLIQRLSKEPTLLDNLEPRALEMIVAKLFEGFGATVHVTKETRDGGYDVGADFQLGDSTYRVLIEAKKWRRDRKVGLGIVDRALGVSHRLSPNKVCIVTTSTFSNVAKQSVATLTSEIDLVDRNGLAGWISAHLVPSPNHGINLPSPDISTNQQV